MIRKAFILAGGIGERLKPLTDETPKPMLEVSGKPILLHAINWLEYNGVEEIILAVGFQKEKIMNYFGGGRRGGARIVYSVEEKPLGTGGALKAAAALLAAEGKDERFLMLNGDNLMDIDYPKMLALHEKNQAQGTIALYEVKDVTGYGVAKMKGAHGAQISEFVEKPEPGRRAPSKRINTGAYILEPGVFGLLPEGFSLIEKTAFPELAKAGKLFGFEHKGQWFPTDDLKRLEAARKGFKPKV